MTTNAKSTYTPMSKSIQAIVICTIIITGVIGFYFIPKQKTTVVTMNDALHLIKDCKVTEAYTGGDGGKGSTTTHAIFKLKDGSVVHAEKNTPLFIFQDAINNTKCS
jgi:hypothetical protein